MTPEEKYRQIRREAAATGLALAALIALWCLLGFGLADSQIMIFGLPLWALAGTLGIWLLAILLTTMLLKFVFKDMSLSDAKEKD